MDRILYKEADGDLTCRARDFDKVFPTLYAYEETGMTPEQIESLKNSYQQLQEINDRTYRSNMAMAEDLNTIKAELKDERHRHDRYVDFELAEAEELQKVKKERDRLAELWAQVPATIKTQVIRICEGEFAEDNNVPGKKEV